LAALAYAGVAFHSSKGEFKMYLVMFLDNDTYDFTPSLHSSFSAAKAAYKDLVRRFDVTIHGDEHGEEPRIYRIECDRKLGEEVTRDLVTT
jgi:hypothetical protein